MGGLRRKVVLVVVALLWLLLLLAVLFMVMVMGEDRHCRDRWHHPSGYREDRHSLRVTSKSSGRSGFLFSRGKSIWPTNWARLGFFQTKRKFLVKTDCLQ